MKKCMNMKLFNSRSIMRPEVLLMAMLLFGFSIGICQASGINLNQLSNDVAVILLSSLRSVEWSYENQIRRIPGIIGDDFLIKSKNGDDNIEGEIAYNLRIINSNRQFSKNFLPSDYGDYLKNKLTNLTTYQNDPNKFLATFSKTCESLRNSNMVTGSTSDLVSFNVEYGFKEDRSVGFFSNIWIGSNVSLVPIFMYGAYNWTNAIYAKRLFHSKNNMRLVFNATMSITKRFYEIEMNIMDKKPTSYEGRVFDAFNDSLMSRLVFSYDTREIPKLRWFMDGLTVGDGIGYIHYIFTIYYDRSNNSINRWKSRYNYTVFVNEFDFSVYKNIVNRKNFIFKVLIGINNYSKIRYGDIEYDLWNNLTGDGMLNNTFNIFAGVSFRIFNFFEIYGKLGSSIGEFGLAVVDWKF